MKDQLDISFLVFQRVLLSTPFNFFLASNPFANHPQSIFFLSITVTMNHFYLGLINFEWCRTIRSPFANAMRYHLNQIDVIYASKCGLLDGSAWLCDGVSPIEIEWKT